MDGGGADVREEFWIGGDRGDDVEDVRVWIGKRSGVFQGLDPRGER